MASGQAGRIMTIKTDAGPGPAAIRRPPVLVRGLVSVAILVYLTAVIAPPLAGPPPASGLSRAIMQPLRPLVGLLHLGHGYRFFAPNPGPGHAIRWTLVRPDGTTSSGTIPDPVRDRPRLLYHRRFMVSEKIASLVPPAGEPAEVQEAARRDWGPLVLNVAHHVLQTHGEGRLTLELVEHFLPGPDEVVRAVVEPDIVTPLGIYESRLTARQPPEPAATSPQAARGLADGTGRRAAGAAFSGPGPRQRGLAEAGR